MANRFQLQIDIDEAKAPEGVAGLLIPIPPTTPHQALEQVALDRSWKAVPVSAADGVQCAWFVSFQEGTHGSPITYEISDSGQLEPEHFTKVQHTDSCVSTDALELADGLGLATCECDEERLERIVGSLASKFQYKSGFTNESPLTCDILTGNCLSINEAFLKLAKVADIPSAYYIGYFFESDESLKSKDWHCWVSTLANQRFDSWDIAHQLKRGMRDIQPALNPVPGVRFATCVGRNLAFDLPTGKVIVPHLCEPRWIFKEGGSRPCEVRISLRRLSHANDDDSGLPVRHIDQRRLTDSMKAQ